MFIGKLETMDADDIKLKDIHDKCFESIELFEKESHFTFLLENSVNNSMSAEIERNTNSL